MISPPRILLISEQPIWPADHGVSVRGYHLINALRQQGVDVSVASIMPIVAHNAAQPPEWVQQINVPWPRATPAQRATYLEGWRGCGVGGRLAMWLRQRVASHQGVEPAVAAGVVDLVERLRPTVVLGLGLHSPLLLRGLGALPDDIRPRSVWYAADELIYYHLSCLRHDRVANWSKRFHEMSLHALIEGLFARGLDGAIGVSPTDTRWLKRVAGVQQAVTIRNGVDFDYFSPSTAGTQHQHGANPQSVVFWGRLDFAPNVDAVDWFARAIWPSLHQRFPKAVWRIVGHSPVPSVQRLAHEPGVEVIGSVPDVRPFARDAAVTVLPLRCGGGIKNKLLEAAAMARPIVASPRAVAGLAMSDGDAPAIVCDSPNAWVDAITHLWTNSEAARAAGHEAHAWAQRHHSWSQAAANLLEWFAEMGWTDHGPGTSIVARQFQRRAA